MSALPEGYSLDKSLISSVRGQVLLARRDADGLEVVLKAYPLAHAPERAQREFERLRALPPGVGPCALALESTSDHSVLVLERLEGTTSRGPMPVADFLELAIAATEALGTIHAARIVHRNLRPENLFWNRRARELRILGFSRAAPLGAPAENEAGDPALDGPLLYMSAEQTARTERGVDFRSDLYALGASFYRLLTGKPPFDARDPRDLIHAHIARRPRPPTEISPDVPGTLARVAMKLLEKQPEDRYQTAEALQIDLETCREQLERTGRIDDELTLGAMDAPYRPLFRQRVYGRAEERAALQRAYRRSAQGAISLVLVRGAPGIGKSALVPELYRPLALDGGQLVRGKFDLYRGHLPYAAVARGLRMLLQQIESESEVRRHEWREALSESLGGLAGALGELVPELSRLLGALPPVPKLEPRETQQRLALSVRRFLLGAARRARPLVLFLDDLQWADAGSRYLLEDLLESREQAPLLVIGSYRDNEVDEANPLTPLLARLRESGVPIEALELGPLGDEAVCEMLADALASSPEAVRELAEQVTRRCGSNPLLIQQCVYHLHELECIRFERGAGWTWDLEAVRGVDLPEDPTRMMLVRLQRLRGESRWVAQLSSCVGDEFDVGLLEQVSQEGRPVLESALYDLSQEGLIAPSPMGYRFVHDRIREAAHTLLPERRRAELHLRTAQLLMDRLAPEEQAKRAFEIADHLIRSKRLLPAELRLEAIDRYRSAGGEAFGAGACATADHYLTEALELFEESDWSDPSGLGFELFLRASECAYQTGAFERALERLAPLESRSFGLLQDGMVAAQRIKIYAIARSDEETMELAVAALHRFGRPRATVRPGWLRLRFEIARTDWALRGPPAQWSLDRPAGPCPELVIQLIYRVSLPASGSIGIGFGCVASADSVLTTLRLGYFASPAFALAAYATARSAVTRSGRQTRRLADAAALWLQRVPDAPFSLHAEHVLHSGPWAWTRSRQSVLEPLRRVAERLFEAGDFEFANLALLFRAHHLALGGGAMDELEEAMAPVRFRSRVISLECLTSPFDALAAPERPHLPLSDVLAELEPLQTFAPAGATVWMMALCFLGQSEEAWGVSERFRKPFFAGTWNGSDFMLYRGWAALGVLGERRGLERWRLRAAVRASLRYLRHWAEYGPDFPHMLMLLRAEQLRVRGRAVRARDLFARAASSARASHHLHHEALAHQRRGELQSALGRPDAAREALARAEELYRSWGATACANALSRAREKAPD